MKRLRAASLSRGDIILTGVKLVSDPNYCAPADLARSNLLVAVLNATETLTDEEAERWAAYSDATEMMRQATNTVLDGARKKDKGIQTIEDVVLHLVNHPADDAYIADLLTSSDYLNLWQVNIERNPWQYDDVLLAEVPRKQREEYCRNRALSRPTHVRMVRHASSMGPGSSRANEIRGRRRRPRGCLFDLRR
ncbi:hypothetical protein [Bradyrhizobium manausense]|uniref:Uncharacterized protein n=1 Tax=Bradyrhizobium manausense TaxID=989370 RepID=A0A0R3E880_9BRAD|nr:hypothetical protein [Bradyrhizobium manausense]KRQ15557.1 hypothetical protein AOQ71_09235 [Bradyrhizobium manausense]